MTALWSDEERVAAGYFMTSSHRTMEGIFLHPVGYASEDLRWPEKKVRKAIAFLTEKEFLRFDSTTNTMLIMDALKFQTAENENQAKACLRRIADLPKTELLLNFHSLAKQHCNRKGSSSFAKIFYQLLSEQLGQQLGQQLPEELTEPLFPLNLNLNLKTKPIILNLKQNIESLNQETRQGMAEESRNVTTGGSGNEPDDQINPIGDPLKDLSPALRQTFEHMKEGL